MTPAGAALLPRVWPDLDAVGADRWRAALGAGAVDTVFTTPEWQAAWWSAFGRGRLLPIGIEDGDRLALLAPLFADGGMAFLVGSGGSDELDLVGDVAAPGALEAVLSRARAETPEFVGMRFHHLPAASPTPARLADAAAALGMTAVAEESHPSPVLDLTDVAARADALGKKSLRRHAAWFRRTGTLEVEHYRSAGEILPHLDPFFAQHVARWEGTPYPSLFHDPAQRAFYRALVERAGPAGWLRFTVVRWDGAAIAYHLGFHYGGRYWWYKPTFDPALARRSPGEALLLALLEAAVDEGAATFELGLGDEPFKARFATRAPLVTTWGVYP